MKYPANTFPRIELSADEEVAFAATAEELVKRTVMQYHEHLTRFNGVVDEYRWKQVKRREDVRVYRERHPGANDEDSEPPLNDLNDATDDKGVAPHLLVLGTTPGLLDDVVYGALCPTEDDMKLKSAYVEDEYLHRTVLVPILSPTPESPLRDLAVKWSVRGHPLLPDSIARRRDAVYIESTGFAQTPNGERIGYHLYRSVELSAARELVELNIVRARIECCCLFRQRTPTTVEVYTRGFIQSGGSATASLAMAYTVGIAVSVWRNVHCAEMKKLTRLLRSAHDDVTGASNFAALSSTNLINSTSSGSSGASGTIATTSSESSSTENKCAVCSERVGGRMSSLSGGSTKDKHCRICDRRVCSRCRVYKEVYSRPEFESAMRPVSITFCTQCVLAVSRASAVKFAEYDARERQGKPVPKSAILEEILPWWSFMAVR
uniref:FYVE-type domain-containing protein n=1 Tax=Globisporangium ultimum (strain ATCC 200006 / CBS 805.95 / DAOM BR144) TaxID=431595 RepID=K3W8N4_GLOUD